MIVANISKPIVSGIPICGTNNGLVLYNKNLTNHTEDSFTVGIG